MLSDRSRIRPFSSTARTVTHSLFMLDAKSIEAPIRCRPCRRGAHHLLLAPPTGGGAGFRTRPREARAGATLAYHFRGTNKYLPALAYDGFHGQSKPKILEGASRLGY